jgi:hypothetical protein
MSNREKCLISLFAVVIITIAFLFSSRNNFMDRNLAKGVKKNVETITEETEKNLKEDTKRNVKRNKKRFIPKNIAVEEVNNYSDFREFPYDDMEYATNAVFEELKGIYEKIDFYSKFEKGDPEKYNFYIQKFKQFLNNKFIFYDPDMRQNIYFKDFSLKYVSADIHNLENNSFYFFDIDGDSVPELCISNNNRTFVCVFDYVADKDKIVLWYSMRNSYYSLNGTKTARWDWDGSRNLLIKLNADGEEEMTLSFYWRNDFNRKKNIEEMYYMLGLPLYAEKSEEDIITDAMKAEAHYDESTTRYYFRVTEEQFDELTKDYFIAAEQADENIKEVTFTYQELFVRP